MARCLIRHTENFTVTWTMFTATLISDSSYAGLDSLQTETFPEDCLMKNWIRNLDEAG
jgi:hypothetical protein